MQYGEHEAVVSIKTGKVLHGRMPRRTLRLVEEWRKLRIKEINLAWKAAQNLESPKKISPLD